VQSGFDVAYIEYHYLTTSALRPATLVKLWTWLRVGDRGVIEHVGDDAGGHGFIQAYFLLDNDFNMPYFWRTRLHL
jgi:hypothetical protein